MERLKHKLILTDADGVLLDWEYGFHRWAEKHHALVLREEGAYGLSKRYEIEKGHAKELTRLFNESSAIRNMAVLRDAKKYVRKLNSDHGFVFGVITSLSDDPDAAQLRRENLHSIFGEDVFDFIQCLSVGADKDEALAPYKGSGCYWIEDKSENYELGLDMGLNSILMAHDHNVNYDKRGVRVHNWREIYNLITGE